MSQSSSGKGSARISKIVDDWDKIVGGPLPERPKSQNLGNSEAANPYTGAVQSEIETVSSDDQNLYTAFALLASWGFEHPIGQMMAWHAEQKLPHTIHQMFTALEKTRGSTDESVAKLKENIRGMISMTYAWAYVMSKTDSLSVKDEHVFEEIAKISDAQPESEARKRLTASAENKLESTVGLLLTARDSAIKESKTNLKLFYEGSLLSIFALSNLYYGKQAQFIEIQ